jgi:hypothetical protein
LTCDVKIIPRDLGLCNFVIYKKRFFNIMEVIDEFLISANTYIITPSTIVFRIIQSLQGEFPSFDFIIYEAKKAVDWPY